jgi:SAM-dependent methyltransferase
MARMPAMSQLERWLCRSGPWRLFTRTVLLPWALQGRALNGHALEVGAGAASMATQLLASHPHVRLTVTDYDHAMVAEARKALARFGERARVEQADAALLRFPESSFDATLSFLMLHHVGSWERALGELVRVLQPDGELFVCDVFETPPARIAHSFTGSPGIRYVGARALEDALAGLPLEDVRIDASRLAFRIYARKTAVTDEPRAPSVDRPS